MPILWACQMALQGRNASNQDESFRHPLRPPLTLGPQALTLC